MTLIEESTKNNRLNQYNDSHFSGSLIRLCVLFSISSVVI